MTAEVRLMNAVPLTYTRVGIWARTIRKTHDHLTSVEYDDRRRGPRSVNLDPRIGPSTIRTPGGRAAVGGISVPVVDDVITVANAEAVLVASSDAASAEPAKLVVEAARVVAASAVVRADAASALAMVRETEAARVEANWRRLWWWRPQWLWLPQRRTRWRRR